MTSITYLGLAGHHGMADRARFHLHTHVNDKYCISTVGRIIVDFATGEQLILGYVERGEEVVPAYYETQVRLLDKEPHKDNDGFLECYCPHGAREVLESNQCCYETTAQTGHIEIVKIFSEIKGIQHGNFRR